MRKLRKSNSRKSVKISHHLSKGSPGIPPPHFSKTPDPYQLSSRTSKSKFRPSIDCNEDQILTSVLIDNSEEDIKIFTGKNYLKKWKKNIKNDTVLSKNYSYFNNNDVLYRGNGYNIVEVFHKNSNCKKLAKVINKARFSSMKTSLPSFEKELMIHETLKSSETILKLETVFETKTHIFMIYEHGELLSFEHFRSIRTKKDLKSIFCQACIALGEINSLKFSVGFLTAENIVRTKDLISGADNFKIFNFPQITKYDQKIKISENDPKISLSSKDYSAHPSCDSRLLGMIMIKAYQFLTFNLVSSKINSNYLKELLQDPGLDHLEKDFVKGVTSQLVNQRIKATDMILHSLFLSMVKKDKNLQRKVVSTLHYTKDLDFNLLEKNLLERSRPKQKKTVLIHRNASISGSMRYSIETRGSKIQLQNKKYSTVSNLHSASKKRNSIFRDKNNNQKKTLKPNLSSFNLRRSDCKSRSRSGRNDSVNEKQIDLLGRGRERSARNLTRTNTPKNSKRRMFKKNKKVPQRILPERTPKKRGFFGKLISGFLCCGER